MRPCLACGYDLSGHGEEARCPECGLLNIPEGYRRQVWELVDSGKWFFSGPFSFFRKRPPGWWWALDRPDDRRRATLRFIRSVGLASLIVIVAAFIASFVAVEETTYIAARRANESFAFYETTCVSRYDWFGVETVIVPGSSVPKGLVIQPGELLVTRTARVVWAPDWGSVPKTLVVASICIVWMLLSWAGPALVGLATQLRKGLPSFARPPRTILGAACLESHRLLYVGAACALMIGFVEFALLSEILATPLSWPRRVSLLTLTGMVGALVFMILFAAAGWISPLRSDYTRQLIRSRFHAGRIILMYAVFFPAAIASGMALLLALVISNEL